MSWTVNAGDWVKQKRSPFYDGANANRERTSVGDATLNYDVPAILEDGVDFTIRTNGDFGVAPSIACIGFGDGYLKDNPLGTGFTSTTDPLTGSAIYSEGDAESLRRVIDLKDGIRALKTTNTTDSLGGGFVGYDVGREIADNEPVFASFWSRFNSDSFALAPNNASQWKSFRFSPEFGLAGGNPNFTPANSGYWKIFATPENLSEDEAGAFTNYLANESAVTFSNVGHATIDDKWTRADIKIRARVDQAGLLKTRIQKPADSEPAYEVTQNPTLLDSGSAQRWRVIQDQTFANALTNSEIWQTDWVFQVGTFARFELANGETPATTTDAKILIPTSWNSNAVTVRLYKQMFPNFQNLFIHYYDANDNFVTSRPLL